MDQPITPMPQKSFASRHPIFTVFLIGVPIVLFISAIGSAGSPDGNTTTPAQSAQVAGTETNAAPANLLALKSVRYYRSVLNEPCANGEVANISDQTLNFVQANIQFRDKNGSLVTPERTYVSVESLPPGRTATFDDCASAADGVVLAQSTISFIGRSEGAAMDSDLQYEDDTKQPAPAAIPTKINAGQTPAAAPAPSPASAPAAAKDNWSSYADTTFQKILDDPGYYLGDKVKVTGMAFDFLGAGGRGGTGNYIEIEDPHNPSSPTARIVLQIGSDANYHLATEALNTVANVRASGNLPDSVVAFGTVRASMDFSLTAGGFVSVPVIEITRIDKCIDLLPLCSLGSTSIFPAGLSTAGTTTANTVQQQQSQPTAPQTTAPSNPRFFQLNVTGACDNYGNGTIILNGYPYADGYSIPSADINAWSNGTVVFTVPSDVPPGTYRVTVRGYEQGSGFCPDANGGSITIH